VSKVLSFSAQHGIVYVFYVKEEIYVLIAKYWKHFVCIFLIHKTSAGARVSTWHKRCFVTNVSRVVSEVASRKTFKKFAIRHAGDLLRISQRLSASERGTTNCAQLYVFLWRQVYIWLRTELEGSLSARFDFDGIMSVNMRGQVCTVQWNGEIYW